MLHDECLADWFLTEECSPECFAFPIVAPSPSKLCLPLSKRHYPPIDRKKPTNFLGWNTGNILSLGTIPHFKEKRDLWIIEFIILQRMSPFYCQRYFKSDLKVCKCLVRTESNRDSIMQPPPATSDEDIVLLPLQIQLDCHYSQKIPQFGKYKAFGLKHLESKRPCSLQLYTIFNQHLN